jgi:hypothetical protein
MSIGARAGKWKITDFFGPSRNAGGDETPTPFARLAPSDENLAMTEHFNAALKTLGQFCSRIYDSFVVKMLFWMKTIKMAWNGPVENLKWPTSQLGRPYLIPEVVQDQMLQYFTI